VNKFVVYSVLVGNFDEIRQPLVVDERFDYIFFSDSQSNKNIGIWQVKNIPYLNADQRLSSRYVKCLATEVLSEYEASLYIDANIQITSSRVYERFIDLFSQGIEWAGICHPDQHCVYDEICAITHLRWIHDYDVVDWYGHMKRDGYPEGNGLFENNVIFRRHTPIVAEAGRLWWKTLKNGVKRDQFSLMYVLGKVSLRAGFFLSENECPRLGSPYFAYYPHNPHSRILHLGFHEMMRYRFIRTMSNGNIREGYHRLFDKLSRYRNPQRMLYVWEAISLFLYGPELFVRMLCHSEK